MQIFLWDSAFSCFGNIPRSGISGSYGNSIFNFLKNRHAVLHSSCTILHYHQQCTRVPISPHPHQHLLFCFWGFFPPVFLIVAIPMSVQWYLIVVSLMIEHLFMCFLAIFISSLEKRLSSPLPIFELGFCYCWVLGVLYIFWGLIPYQIYDLQIFSPILCVTFSFCWYCLLMQKSF